jgi:hypothetical protein
MALEQEPSGNVCEKTIVRSECPVENQFRIICGHELLVGCEIVECRQQHEQMRTLLASVT